MNGTKEDYSQIQASMNFVNQQKNIMLDLFECFGRSVQDVYAESQGRYAESFLQQYNELKQVFPSFENTLNDIAQNLGLTMEKTQEKDAALEQKAEETNTVL